MNMTNVLHRRRTAAAPDLTPANPGIAPPRPPAGPTPWPDNARWIVAALTVVTVLAVVVAMVVAASAGDSATERELGARVDALTVERDDAVDRVAELDAEIATVRDDLLDAQTDNGVLTDRTVDLEARVAELIGQRAEALREVDDLTGALDEAKADIGVFTVSLATAERRIEDAIAERDELRARFPAKFDASLDGASIVGKHNVKLSTMYCAGFACGGAPAVGPITISRNSAGHLRASVPGLAEGGLFAGDGVLHLVADSTSAVPACDGAARTAGVVMTVVPAGYQIAADGARTVSGLSAVITVEAPPVGECPAGLAFYSATLTPAK